MKKKLPFIVIGIVVLLMILGVIIAVSTKPQTQNYSSLADEAFSKHEYSLSVQLYKKAINQTPSDINNYVKVAKVYYLKNNFEEGIKFLDEAPSTVKNTKEVLVEYYKDYLNLIKLDKAFEIAQKLLEIDKTSEEYIGYKLEILNLQSKTTDYKNQLESFIKDNSSKSLMLNYYAGLLNYLNIQIANNYINTVKNVIPATDIDKTLKQHLQDYQDILSSSIADTQKKKDLTNKAKVGRLMILENLNDFSLPFFDEIIQKNPEYYETYYLRGLAYLKKNDLKNAVADLEKAVNQNSSKDEPLALLAKVYELQKDYVKSKDTYEKSINLNSNNENVLSDFARMLAVSGNYEQAAIQYKKLIALNSTLNIDYRIEFSKFALEKSINYTDVLEQTDYLKLKWDGFNSTDDIKKAMIKDYAEWAAYKKAEPSAKDTNSLIQNTIRNYENIIKLDPYNPSINLHLGTLYSSNNVTKAILYLEKCIDFDIDNSYTSQAQLLIDKLK